MDPFPTASCWSRVAVIISGRHVPVRSENGELAIIGAVITVLHKHGNEV